MIKSQSYYFGFCLVMTDEVNQSTVRAYLFFLPGQCAHLTAFIYSSRPNAVQPFHLIKKRTKLSLSCPSSHLSPPIKSERHFIIWKVLNVFCFRG